MLGRWAVSFKRQFVQNVEKAKFDLWWPLVTRPLTSPKKWPKHFRYDFSRSLECRLGAACHYMPRNRIRGCSLPPPCKPARSAPSTGPAWVKIYKVSMVEAKAVFTWCSTSRNWDAVPQYYVYPRPISAAYTGDTGWERPPVSTLRHTTCSSCSCR